MESGEDLSNKPARIEADAHEQNQGAGTISTNTRHIRVNSTSSIIHHYLSASTSASTSFADLVNLALTLCINVGFEGTSEASTSLLVSKLNMLPKQSAITVQVRIMTLYGILKSGVGSARSSEVVRVV